ncbi:MAG: ABC transporter permease subunit, partial [Planctomycetes bacterium]|nr:ABC transporter permease subunit [Planctomycetota bacterium]
MNSNVVRALFRDAYAQVIDNRVFRILLVILGVLVLPTFVIGARPEHLTVLFFWDYSYDEIFGFFGTAVSSMEHPDRVLIQAVQKILTDGLAGSFGIMFGIAATAFFVPRMLEKGAADVVFSKPVSRFALLLTRYFAGLIFAAVLATTMIGGMHLGFLLLSGWSDPGFLWSIPILIYVFAVVHAVSVLVGTVTRSSVAAMLVTLIFFLVNSAVHQAWHLSQRVRGEARVVEAELEETEPGDASASSDDEDDTFLRTAVFMLDTAHFVLPKTTEADFIARSTRLRLERRGYEFWDRDTNFFVAEPPEGFTREAGADID